MSDLPILRVLDGASVRPPPVWMMRQAGRYLPEYRAVRQEAGSFLDLCYTPRLAAEVTLQPIRRFGFDAAILFSDILVVPHALGSEVTFVEGEGPRLSPTTSREDIDQLADELPLERLAPVFETVERVRASLPPETTLLGFCGAPWTVASYMIAGRGTPDQAPSRQAAQTDPIFMTALIDRLVEASIVYLAAQLEAGADAVQLFESHAGSLDPTSFELLSLEPMRRIVDGLRARRPGAKVIVFCRGAGVRGLVRLAEEGLGNALGIDQGIRLDDALAALPERLPTQGNLDPETLIAGGARLDEAVDRILAVTAGRPHIFNLGHGITPQTPIAHVEQMLRRVRAS